MRRGLVAALAVAMALTGPAGCRSAAPPRGTTAAADPAARVASPPPVAAAAAIGEPGRLTLPLDAYVATPAQAALVVRARTELVDRCLSRFGFAARPVAGRHAPPAAEDRSWRYGLADPEHARRYGYHPAPADATDPPVHRPGRQSAAERGVRTGATADHGGMRVPAGGCVGEAERALGRVGDDTYLDDLRARTLAVAAFQQSAQDPRVVAVKGRWRACVSAAGHPLADPRPGPDTPGAVVAAPGGRPTPEEPTHLPGPRQAVVDVACKRRVGLVGVWYAVEVAYQEVLVRQNAAELERGRRSVETAVRAAAAVLGVPAPTR